jgi:nucleoside 2-deoxyribosyltransferase
MPARSDEYTTGTAKNRLRHMRGYLCGAMDRVADGGETWRVALQRNLADLDIYWLDPTHKPIEVGIEDAALREEIRKLKHQGLYDEVAPPIKVIRAVDLRMVDISDFLVVNLNLEVHACGTYEELFLANRQKKPVIVHVEQGKENAPNWLFATLPHELIFSNWEDIQNYLRHVAKDSAVQHFNRWMFFDFDMCRKF